MTVELCAVCCTSLCPVSPLTGDCVRVSRMTRLSWSMTPASTVFVKTLITHRSSVELVMVRFMYGMPTVYKSSRDVKVTVLHMLAFVCACAYVLLSGGTTAAAPPPFRPGNPARCGSHPLVTPY